MSTFLRIVRSNQTDWSEFLLSSTFLIHLNCYLFARLNITCESELTHSFEFSILSPLNDFFFFHGHRTKIENRWILRKIIHSSIPLHSVIWNQDYYASIDFSPHFSNTNYLLFLQLYPISFDTPCFLRLSNIHF